MVIKFMCYCPHPPVAVAAVGGERSAEVRRTATALEQLGHELSGCLEEGLETVICITPHGPVFQDAVALWQVPALAGDLSQFGAGNVRLAFAMDQELGQAIIARAERDGIVTAQLDEQLAARYRIPAELDHGIVVPLSFFPALQEKQIKLVAITIGFLTGEELYRFGMAVAGAVEALGRQVAIVVSGDLSHRLQPDAPAGYHPSGQKFDTLVANYLEKGAVAELYQLDPELVEQAGECGYRPLVMALGILDRRDFQARVLSYEAPFGVGYLVARFELGPELAAGRLGDLKAAQKSKLAELRKRESPPVKLARQTVEQLVKGEKIDFSPAPLQGFAEPRGAFVTLKKQGQLRGCIGTIEPATDNATMEIVANAVKAAQQDPRFAPVGEEELEELEYSVDILDSPEPVASEAELDPAVYGVIVEAGAKRGLLLPDLPGVDTAAQQVAIARQKAGIGPGEKVQLYRFKVTRYT